MEIEAYTIGGRWLGTFSSFGEAKRVQQDSLPEDLQPAYAGIHEGAPLFYKEMLTPELLGRYPQLVGEN